MKDWPEEDYGEFYNGDSYIILNVSVNILASFCMSLLKKTLLESKCRATQVHASIKAQTSGMEGVYELISIKVSLLFLRAA